MLCEFEDPGNVRALRNLIYELTSYLGEFANGNENHSGAD